MSISNSSALSSFLSVMFSLRYLHLALGCDATAESKYGRVCLSTRFWHFSHQLHFTGWILLRNFLGNLGSGSSTSPDMSIPSDG